MVFMYVNDDSDINDMGRMSWWKCFWNESVFTFYEYNISAGSDTIFVLLLLDHTKFNVYSAIK